MVYKLVELCLPRNHGTMHLKMLMSTEIMDFCMLYFDFWSSCFSTLLFQSLQVGFGAYIYNVPVTSGVIFECVSALIW